MSSPSPKQPAMQAVVEAAIAGLERLLGLLREETERLKARNIDGLEQLLGDKLAALQSLEQCERERQAAVEAAGYAGDPAGMQAFLAAAGDPELGAAWEKLKALLQRVQIFNEANGKVIHRSLDQVDSQLALLRGDALENGGAYGPGGSTRGRSGGREISRA